MLRPVAPPSWIKAREIAARVASPVGKPFAAAKKGKVAELYIYDAIGKDPWTDTGIDPADVVAAVAEAKGADELAIHINSPGGLVFDGIAVFNAIRAFAGRKVVYVDGLAASIASIIAMAGDRVVMNPGSMFMIHDPMGGIFSFGSADQIEDESRKTVNALRKIRETLLSIYTDATGRPVSEISAWMTAETWMSAEESVARGFADEIVKAPAEEEKPEARTAAPSAPRAAAAVSPDAVADLARARFRVLSQKYPGPAPAQSTGRPVKTETQNRVTTPGSTKESKP